MHFVIAIDPATVRGGIANVYICTVIIPRFLTQKRHALHSRSYPRPFEVCLGLHLAQFKLKKVKSQWYEVINPSGSRSLRAF